MKPLNLINYIRIFNRFSLGNVGSTYIQIYDTRESKIYIRVGSNKLPLITAISASNFMSHLQSPETCGWCDLYFDSHVIMRVLQFSFYKMLFHIIS